MAWDNYVIDATLSKDGLLCFCPIEGDIKGEHSVVFGMSYIGDGPPPNGKLVGIVHLDGQAAVDKWCADNQATLQRFGFKEPNAIEF